MSQGGKAARSGSTMVPLEKKGEALDLAAK